MRKSWQVFGAGTAIVVGALAMGCGDGDDGPSIVVDTFNVALAGAFIPYEEERRQPVADAVGAMESDIVCLQEVWRQSDKDLIAAAAAGAFPHIVSFEHDLSTPVADPTNQDGTTPPARTSPPCSGELEASMTAAVDCLSEHCSTDPGQDGGRTTSVTCAAEHCVDTIVPLLMGTGEMLQCYACIASSLPVETFGDIRDLCTTENEATVAFRGQSGVMLLSRHPLSNAGAVVWPGTWNRRIVASATASLPEGGDVDVYCNHLSPIFTEIVYPYTGAYGLGETGPEGWAAEQLLQAERLVELVQAQTGAGRAIIMGDMNAGPTDEDLGLVGEGEATFDLLEGAFTLGVSSSYEPRCTMCPDSPVRTEDSDAVWIDHIFTHNFPASAVRRTERTFDENVVDAGGGEMVPLSDHYGLRSRIRVGE